MTYKRLANFDDLPDSALISAKELTALSGRSRTSLWHDVMRGNLANPITIGKRSIKWRASDVRGFLYGASDNG